MEEEYQREAELRVDTTINGPPETTSLSLSKTMKEIPSP